MSVGLFAAMNVLIKLCEAHGARLPEILLFRQIGAGALMIGILLAGPGLASVATRRMPAHLMRAAVGLIAMAFTFTGILALPLAESTTIGFTMPIFATILGAVLLREPTGLHRWIAVLVGFGGVLIVAQPGSGHFPLWGTGCALAGALLTASVSILLRQISQTEAPLTTVFWFSTLSVMPLGVLYAFVWQTHPAIVWLLLAAVGLLGGVAQLAMTSALRFGPVSVVVPMDYSSLLWATALSWAVFGVLPTRWTLLGAPVIIASGLYIVWREHVRRVPKAIEIAQ